METTEQDTIQLLTVFPQEVWQVILHKISDCATILELQECFPFFASLESSLRSQTLFLAAAENLFSYLLKTSTSSDTVISTILNCRQVCHAWKHGVDFFLENTDPHLQLMPNKLCNKYPKHLHYFLNNFYSVPNVKQFYNYFSVSHTFSSGDPNPLVSRNVAILLDDLSTNRRFLKHILRVLKRWGHHIWFIYFRITHNASNPYAYFSRFMEYLPNIKVLNVMVFNNTNGATNEFNLSFDNIPTFQHYPELQCIKTYDLPELVCDKLKERNWHVTQVDQVTPKDLMRKKEKEEERNSKYFHKRPREDVREFADRPVMKRRKLLLNKHNNNILEENVLFRRNRYDRRNGYWNWVD